MVTLLSHCHHVVVTLLCNGHIVVRLLSHCLHVVVTLLSHGHIVVTWSCCLIVVTWSHCYHVVTLLSRCCHMATWSHCCHGVVSLLSCCCHMVTLLSHGHVVVSLLSHGHIVVSLLSHGHIVITLSHCCHVVVTWPHGHIVVTVLSHGHVVVTLLSQCCLIVVMLLSHGHIVVTWSCCLIVVTLLSRCCLIVVMLLSYGHVVVTLLSRCCLIVVMLLSHCYHMATLLSPQTASVCLKAFESLLLLSALQTESSGELLADHTQLGELLTGRLLQLYALLPLESLDAGELQSWPHTPWSSQFSHCRSDLSSKSSSSNQMNNFFSWLDFLDHLMREAPQVLAVKIAQCVHRFWLFDILQPQLLHTCEQVVLVSTSILCVAVRLVKSWSLLDQLVHFLLKTPPLPELLLQRCDHISDQISLASLCLVEELLQKPHRDILEVLVVTFLQSRSYLSAPAAGQEDTPLQSNQANEDSDDLEEDPFFSDSLLFSDSLPPPPLSSASSSAAPPSGLGSAADVVNSFLCLVPVQVRSAQLLQEGGFESYVHDAHTQVTQCESLSLSWDWPLSLPSSSGEGEEFFEGHLLKVLFDRLGRVLEQPYELNLRLTAVLSRLSAFNHPLLQEYLLDPYIHLSHCSRSLFSVLIRLMGELMQRVQLVSNLTDRLLNTRRDLLGLNHDIGLEHLTLLRGLVVLEEFCQELAAIAFVKLPKDQVVTPLDQQGLAWTSRDSPGPVVNPPDQQ
ncbi:FHF complex subunit HOOK-interacting protein 2B isoform X1 [Pseudoliparis swirei]|uniref:FHF complex subunit HOOK-interacting protein 2B isoform X1 n=1 Tax=Pseudoliparis swirei TaxID=2059687 RepID=UPI0024BED68B|nr:FHF complex subunit HOOK-interacting protein 2B isoform X1 [Pseudoliparis swirei]